MPALLILAQKYIIHPRGAHLWHRHRRRWSQEFLLALSDTPDRPRPSRRDVNPPLNRKAAGRAGQQAVRGPDQIRPHSSLDPPTPTCAPGAAASKGLVTSKCRWLILNRDISTGAFAWAVTHTSSAPDLGEYLRGSPPSWGQMEQRNSTRSVSEFHMLLGVKHQ